MRYFLKPFCFLSLTMAFISIWIKKRPAIWGGFVACSIVLGFIAKVIAIQGILIILLLGALIWLLRFLEGAKRWVVIFGVLIFSLGLWFHLLPGFSNWKIDEGTLSPRAHSYALWFNFDKPFPAIFLLSWVIPTITNWGDWKKMFKKAIPWMLVGVGLLIFLALTGNLVEWSPKLPKSTLFFLWANLFFVSLPEEVLLRGLLQRELCRVFGKKIWGQIICIACVSLFFALLHVRWIHNHYYIFLVFIAGLFFGGIYQYTKSIEASIICHFLFNATHFLLFTFPMLL